jgi:hypothetical protein
MVQAWRLYRAHHKHKAELAQKKEREDDQEWEKKVLENKYPKSIVDKQRKEREVENKRRRGEEKKLAEIPLLNFIREVVMLTVKKHSTTNRGAITSQSEASATLGPIAAGQLTTGGKLTAAVLEGVRYDSGDHLPRKSKVRGVCKECSKRTIFRCIRCKVALHPECFYVFHVPEHLRESDDTYE